MSKRNEETKTAKKNPESEQEVKSLSLTDLDQVVGGLMDSKYECNCGEIKMSG